jgi:uncharacterized membrane protein (DUF4010 family)
MPAFPDMLDLFQRLGVALAIGLLVGLERGWKERGEPGDATALGFRTFALTGLLGGTWGAIARTLPDAGGVILGLAFVAFSGAILLYRLREQEREGTFGATTIVAAMLVFALGAMAVLGNVVAAAAAGVAVAGILALKGAAEELLDKLTWPELRATLVLLAMTVILLPILPDHGYGPGGVLNPRELWLMTTLIAAASFAGYVAVRLAGERSGIAITGLAGGLVSSTAVTVTLARLVGPHADRARLLMGGATLAGAVSMSRVLVIAGLLNWELLRWLLPSLGAAALAMLLHGAYAIRDGEVEEASAKSLHLTNPFELTTVLKFGALLAAVLLAAEVLIMLLGSRGVLVLAALSGIADVDAITLSLSRLANGAITPQLAAVGVLLAVLVNAVAKCVMAQMTGGRVAMFNLARPSALAVLAGGLGLAAALWLDPLSAVLGTR